MKECECGKTNQSLDGSEPLPKDQAANLTTHSTPKQRGKGTNAHHAHQMVRTEEKLKRENLSIPEGLSLTSSFRTNMRHSNH